MQTDRFTRRQILTAGAASALGLTLPDFLRLRALAKNRAESPRETSRSFGSAKHVIFVFLHGGHPQHETFDPKVHAPAEIRGEFGEIPTTVPGVRFSELFPHCAKIADRMTVIRSMAHDNPNHVQACLPAMTGHFHPPEVRSRGDFPPSPENFPHFGAVWDHLRRRDAALPPWVQIGPRMTRNNGTVLHGQSCGFLGSRHSPFVVDQDLTGEEIRIEAMSAEVHVSRMKNRRRLLAQFDAQRAGLDQAAGDLKDAFFQRAHQLLTSSAARDAFDLSAEPAKARRRYPRSQVGQSCLLARRLIEAGVPFVNVHWCKKPPTSWDTHGANFKKMKQSLGPTLDQSFSALVDDLQERGRLDETLVIAMAEFGRTPKINRNAGRDHWPWVYCLAMAGAGLARGAVYGASDRLGAYPVTKPHSPADMAATIYHLLGVDPHTHLYDMADRPHRLIMGKRIDAILAG